MYKRHMKDPMKMKDTNNNVCGQSQIKAYGTIGYNEGRWFCVCRKCNYSVNTLESFQAHMETAHAKRKRAGPYQHMESMPKLHRIHSEYPYYPRKIKKPEYNPHNMFCKEEKPSFRSKYNVYGCDQCSSKFSDIIELNVHNRQCHRKVRSGEVCPFCNKSYATQSGFWNHIKAMHAQELPFLCNMCPKRFKNKKELITHKNFKHVTGKIIECDQCEAKFVTAYERNNHNKEMHGPKAKPKYTEFTMSSDSDSSESSGPFYE